MNRPMLPKPSLSFYTNMPTPYQLSFFKELANHFTLKVIFYSISEKDRFWEFSFDEEDYEVIFLKDNFIAKFIQKWVIDFHFSWKIFSVSFNDKSNNVIVGGSYWVPNAFIAMILGKVKSKKIAYFSEPLYEVKSKLKYYTKWICLRGLNMCCDAVFCVGNKAGISFTNYQVKLPQFIIPYNIDPEAFQNLDAAKIAEYHSQYKEGYDILILSSGSLIHRKGMDVLIKAFREIRNPKAKLIIVGEGSQKEELRRLCSDDGRIVLAGFQHPNELPYFFAIADIFAFASRYDGWAVVINEAIAANVPIISSRNVGAAVELLTSLDLGILCDSDQVEQFKDAMESLIVDEEKRKHLKTNSIKLIPYISSSFCAKKVYDIFHAKI